MTKIEKTCERCGATYQISAAGNPYWFRNHRRFCSRRCAARATTPRHPIADRFWKCVDQSEGAAACWLWTGSKDGSWGYGAEIMYEGKRERPHRVSYQLHFGEIPDSLWVLHSCDNPPCVNPDHLFLGDHAANMRDMKDKGRARAGPGTGLGEANGKAKLAEADVRQIRDGAEAAGPLARRFGITREAIYSIRSRKTWRHI